MRMVKNEYYKSDDSDLLIRIDTTRRRIFARTPGGREVELNNRSEIATDAVIANNTITEEEYFSDSSEGTDKAVAR